MKSYFLIGIQKQNTKFLTIMILNGMKFSHSSLPLSGNQGVKHYLGLGFSEAFEPGLIKYRKKIVSDFKSSGGTL